MRLGTVVLPVHRWSEGQKMWRRAEDLGFHAACTYDHLSWRSFR
ncbi:LLM class flavin-dependent oxidoreductase, partial [Kitasatospora indigofera]